MEGLFLWLSTASGRPPRDTVCLRVSPLSYAGFPSAPSSRLEVKAEADLDVTLLPTQPFRGPYSDPRHAWGFEDTARGSLHGSIWISVGPVSAPTALDVCLRL